MQNPGYNKGITIFFEGEWLPFKIHNLVQLQDDAWYFVLQDINGLKHFLPAENYKSYGFKTGDEITCKIDKINCTGRIYLEPKHPCYREGENYYFDVLNDAIPHQKDVWILRDILGNNIEVTVNSIINIDIKEEKKVRCIVKSIKKGRPILDIYPKVT